MGTPGRRERALRLREDYGFAAQQLSLYLALLDVWESCDDVDTALPLVMKATRTAGPQALAEAVEAIDDPWACLRTWLDGGELPPVPRYLARATLRAVEPEESIDATSTTEVGDRVGSQLGPSTEAGPGRSAAPTAGVCPHCGGLAQLSCREPGGEPLASGERRLQCARCWRSWKFSASTCPWCGESSGAQRTIYSDPKQLSHLRIEGCSSCRRYLIDVDRGREPAAVAEVDELVAVPLDLYATEIGLTKITPNLMGF
jgi:hypothetical protein